MKDCILPSPPFRRLLAGIRLAAVARATLLLLPLIAAGPTACIDPGNADTGAYSDSAIADAIGKAGPGSTVVVPPGRYRIAELEVPPGVTLHAPAGATLVGKLIARGPGTVIRGFTFSAGMIDLSNSRSVSVGDCVFNGGTTAITLDHASGALIINNDFHGVSGEAVTGWAVDRSTFSGNHFFDCGQCINLAFTDDRTRGRGIVVERNIFRRTTRMPIEVGPVGAYTRDLVVRDNWADDFRNRGPDPGQTMSTFVAYSLVPTHGIGTVVTGNYARAGSQGRGDIGIELAGSGEIAGNHIEDFRYGAIVYGAGFHVHDNSFVNATTVPVLNYGKRHGRIALRERPGDAMQPPSRRSWP